MHRLADTIREGTALAGTDGPYKQGHGTAALRICNDHGDAFTCYQQTPGSEADQTPYRSEVGGIVGILRALDCFMKHYELENGNVVIVTEQGSRPSLIIDPAPHLMTTMTS
jgi:hypothetical protein